ncbi:LLM class flavin-dependent oxidoreductase [Mycolicibacterium palauense]|uniref:LLM class flavin-dependent oxidoreductase n=1 Tax=Mycolicibacterium palauense TaxID=2034511 RepID=UPI00159BBB6B|nr:LLM class flavin-dependent oxidoreductase [Mycolicibacterium palauense]
MRSAVTLQPVYPPAEFRRISAEIEDLGFDELWLTDSSLHARNCYAYLTLAAMATSRIALGTAVTNPLTRHPAVGASAIAAVDEISGGRARYGIGVGDRPLESLGLRPAKLATLEDAVSVSRRLWRGDDVTCAAEGFRLEQAHMKFPPAAPIPVYLSASGPRTLELAGRIADGVIILAGLHPDGIRYALQHIDRGVEQAGRGERPTINVFAYGQISEDTESALQAARTIAAWFPQTAPVYCELAGLPRSLVEQVRSTYTGGEFQEAQAAAALLPDDFVRRMALAGNRSDAVAHIRTLAAVGVDTLTVFPIGGDQPSRIATIGAFAEAMREAG